MTSQKSTHSFSFKFFYAFLSNKSGGIGFLVLGFTFIGIGLVGIALDHHMYTDFQKKVKSDADSAILAGGIVCRETYIKTNNFTQASQEGRREAEDFLLKTKSFARSTGPGSRTTPTSSYTITSLRNAGTVTAPEGCLINIDYENNFKTTFSSLFGLSFYSYRDKASAFANIELVASDIEIDFLIDVSSSMSTIADPSQRDLVTALNITPEKGCIFLCHLRKALIPRSATKNVFDFADKRITSLPADYSYHHNGGSRIVDLRPYSLKRRPKAYTYFGPSSTTSHAAEEIMNGDSLISIEELLDLFNIKLKTDLLYESTQKLIAQLNATPDRSRIRIAFHRFATDLDTFIPKNQPNETQTLSSLRPTDLLPYHFEYGTREDEANLFFYHSVFPSTPANLSSLALYAPPTGSTLTNSIPRPTNNPDYAVGSARSLTYIPRIFTQFLAKIAARTPLTRRTQRVVVIITDGVKDENQTTSLGADTRLYNPAICDPLKDQKILLMVIHSYYRLQPGHGPSDGLRNILSGLPPLTPDNVDILEKRINEEGLRDKFLLPCASVNPKPKVGEFPHYYFPGDNIAQLEQSFHDLLDSILNADKKEPPVRIQY